MGSGREGGGVTGRQRVDVERAAARCRVPVRVEGAPLDLVAEVLAAHHGDPMRLMEGEPLPSHS